MITLALFQPEIPQNTGTLLRLGACLNFPVQIIEPCGFGLSDRLLKRAGMDYLELSTLHKHACFDDFQDQMSIQQRRILYLTPHATCSYLEFSFQPNDCLLMGRESDGLPECYAQHINPSHHLTIPMTSMARSINVALAATLVLGEALRQTQQFPKGS